MDGIIIVSDDDIRLMVSGSGLNESILKSITDQYLQREQTITTIAKADPSRLEAATAAMADELDINTEISLSGSNLDNTTEYFYALLAMTCLFGGYAALFNVQSLQANQSPLGIRKSSSPHPRPSRFSATFWQPSLFSLSAQS